MMVSVTGYEYIIYTEALYVGFRISVWTDGTRCEKGVQAQARDAGHGGAEVAAVLPLPASIRYYRNHV